MATEQSPKIKLFWLDQSRSQRIVWLLEELKVPYDIEIFYRNKSTMMAPPELEKIHMLGKSPIIEVTPPPASSDDAGAATTIPPIVLAESGFMTQYLCEHFAEGRDRLTPKKWKEGKEGQVGGETEEWLRWQYYLHYCEGSLMPIVVTSVLLSQLKSPSVPFFIRPITSSIVNRINSAFMYPTARKHMAMLEDQLATSPNGGKYLCGDHLTAADVLMSFPLTGGKKLLDGLGAWEGGSWAKEFPKVGAYAEMLQQEEGFKRAEEKVKNLEARGAGKPSL